MFFLVLVSLSARVSLLANLSESRSSRGVHACTGARRRPTVMLCKNHNAIPDLHPPNVSEGGANLVSIWTVVAFFVCVCVCLFFLCASERQVLVVTAPHTDVCESAK